MYLRDHVTDGTSYSSCQVKNGTGYDSVAQSSLIPVTSNFIDPLLSFWLWLQIHGTTG